MSREEMLKVGRNWAILGVLIYLLLVKILTVSADVLSDSIVQQLDAYNWQVHAERIK